MTAMISIDGSLGEGGGQVLRTSLALSLVTGKPFRIDNIRAGRKSPGLLRQHLTAVGAATQVGEARVEGAAMGSTSMTFVPHALKAGDYAFAIGTAGSTTLVLQTILLPLAVAGGPSTVVIDGGTHNPAAPPFDFLDQAFLPLLRRMGAIVEVELVRPGFFPAGGGQIRATITPAGRLARLDLGSRGALVRGTVRAVVANLGYSIAQREVRVAGAVLGWKDEALQAHALTGSMGPGNAVSIIVESEHVTDVFTGFGERGVRAEVVAEKAASEAKQYLDSNAAVGEHLADQLLLPMALGEGGSFTTLPPTGHMTTNATIIRKFLDVEIAIESGEVTTVRVG
jgi:RNA 3'-terminal phosphate cyclase (ATP)